MRISLSYILSYLLLAHSIFAAPLPDGDPSQCECVVEWVTVTSFVCAGEHPQTTVTTTPLTTTISVKELPASKTTTCEQDQYVWPIQESYIVQPWQTSRQISTPSTRLLGAFQTPSMVRLLPVKQNNNSTTSQTTPPVIPSTSTTAQICLECIKPTTITSVVTTVQDCTTSFTARGTYTVNNEFVIIVSVVPTSFVYTSSLTVVVTSTITSPMSTSTSTSTLPSPLTTTLQSKMTEITVSTTVISVLISGNVNLLPASRTVFISVPTTKVDPTSASQTTTQTLPTITAITTMPSYILSMPSYLSSYLPYCSDNDSWQSGDWWENVYTTSTTVITVTNTHSVTITIQPTES